MAMLAHVLRALARPAYTAFLLGLAVSSIDGQAQPSSPGLSPEVYAACNAELEAARTELAASNAAFAEVRAQLAEENVRRSQLPEQIQIFLARIISEFRGQLSLEDQARLQSFGRDHAVIMALNGGRRTFTSSVGTGSDLSEHASSFLGSLFNRQEDSVWRTLGEAIQTVSGRDPRSATADHRAFRLEHLFQTINSDGVARPMMARIEFFFSGEGPTPLIQMGASVEMDPEARRRFSNFGVSGATAGGFVPGITAVANLLTGSVTYSGELVLGTRDFNRVAQSLERRRPNPASLVCQLLIDRGFGSVTLPR